MATRIALFDSEEGHSPVESLIESGKVELFHTRTPGEVDRAWSTVLKHPENYHRVVLDTATQTVSKLIEEVLLGPGGRTLNWAEKFNLHMNKDKWGQVSSHGRLLVSTLFDSGIPFQVALLCHEASRTDPTTEIEMFGPSLPPKVLGSIYGLSDAIVRLARAGQQTKIGEEKYPAGTRILRLQDNAKYMAKGRDTLPYQRPELLALPTVTDLHTNNAYSAFLAVCKPHPRRVVVYGPSGVGKTVFACSD
jgi:hypothetical protein